MNRDIRHEGISPRIVEYAFSGFYAKKPKEGLAAARAKGKQLGRPKGALGTSKLTGREADIQDLLSKTVSKASIAKIMGVSRSTLHHFICSRHLA